MKIYATSKPKIKWIRNSATHYVIDDDRYSGFVEKTRSGWWRVYVTTDSISELHTSADSLRDAKRMVEEFISEDVESSYTGDRFYYIYELYDENNEQLDPYEDTYVFNDEDSARKAAQTLIDSGEYRRIECVRDKFEYDSNGIGDLIGSDTVFVLSSRVNNQHGG